MVVYLDSGELCFRFSNENMNFYYGFNGDWFSRGVWINGGVIYSKDLWELEWK